MRAYILCGGFGTRLKSVTKNTQKAMVEVHGQPFLLKVLEQLALAGVTEAVLCAHYRADQIADNLQLLSEQTGLSLQIVVEGVPLGTGGALLNALRECPPEQRYLVLNADTFLDAEAYSQLIASQGQAIIGVSVDDRSRYGSLAVNDRGLLSGFQEKGKIGAGVVNAGVYVFESDTFSAKSITACSLETDLLPPLLSHTPVSVVKYTGRFIDIGTPESLALYAQNHQKNIFL